MKIKKVLQIILTLTLSCVSMFGITAYADPGDQITVDAPSTVGSNSSFQVVVKVGNVTNLYGVQVDMQFDADFFTVNSIEKYSVFGSESSREVEIKAEVNNTTGEVNYCRVLTGTGNGVDISTPVNAFILNCTSKQKGGVWDHTLTNDGTAILESDGMNIRVLLSDSNGNPISTNALTSEVSFTGFSGWIVTSEQNGVVLERIRYDSGVLVEKNVFNTDGTVYSKVFYYDDGTSMRLRTFFHQDSGNRYYTENFDIVGNRTSKIYYYDSTQSPMRLRTFFVSGADNRDYMENFNESGTMTSKIYYYSNGIDMRLRTFFANSVRDYTENFDTSGNRTSKIYYFDDAESTMRLRTFFVPGTDNRDYTETFSADAVLVNKLYYESDGNTWRVRTFLYTNNNRNYTENFVSGILNSRVYYYDDAANGMRTRGFYDNTTGIRIYTEFFNASVQLTLKTYYHGDGTTKRLDTVFDPNTGQVTSQQYYDESGNPI